jgi:hypothetical protein
MSQLWLPPSLGHRVDPAAAGWRKIPPPKKLALKVDAFSHPKRLLVAMRGMEAGRWHLSVSHRDRVPSWEELGFARDALLPPDVWLMVVHPPRAFWLNLMPKVLHLWQFDDPVLIGMFTREGVAAQALGVGEPSP